MRREKSTATGAKKTSVRRVRAAPRSAPGRAAASLQKELAAAKKAALSAGSALRRHFRHRSFEVSSKGYDNPVTSADLEADRSIRELLGAAFPDYGWLSEETSDDRSRLKRRRVWIVDPLDGTKEFIAGIPEFVVSIALAENGVPILGVTYNPLKREMFWAVRGRGAHLGRRPIRVSRVRTLARATVLASRSETARGEWREFARRMTVSPTGSVAYKLALVACGRADATFSRTPKSEWDIAAGAALVTLAGGRVSDITGEELRFNQPRVTVGGLLASNPSLYPQILKLARR